MSELYKEFLKNSLDHSKSILEVNALLLLCGRGDRVSRQVDNISLKNEYNQSLTLGLS